MLKIDDYKSHHVLTFDVNHNALGGVMRFWWFNRTYAPPAGFKFHSIHTDYGVSADNLFQVAENIETLDEAVKFCMDYLNK